MDRPLITSQTQAVSSAVPPSHSLSGLPAELIVHIFTLAASSSKQCALSLCQVSTWTYTVAHPYLFSVVILRDAHDILRLRFGHDSFLIHSNPPEPFIRDFGHPAAIRSIWVENCAADSLLPGTLISLENVIGLALSEAALLMLINVTSGVKEMRNPSRDLHLTILDSPARWAAVLQRSRPHESEPRSSIYEMVTRLRFVEPFRLLPGSANEPDRLDNTTAFPRLTHFAVSFVYDSRVEHELLWLFTDALARQPQGLRLFVLVFYDDEFRKADGFAQWFRETRKQNHRLHLVNLSREEVQREWKEEAEGGESLWDRAVRYTKEWETSTQPEIGGYNG